MSRLRVPAIIRVLAWAVILAAVWAFPSVISIYGVLWILLPCQLVYMGFRFGVKHRRGSVKVATVLASGACEALATIVIGAPLNIFRGWNIYFPLLDYLAIGLVASSIGLLFSYLTCRRRVGHGTE